MHGENPAAAPAEAVWQNYGIATMADGAGPYGAIDNGALAVRDGRILWAGKRTDLPPALIGPQRALDHTLPDRLPHAPGIRRQSGS